MLLSQEDRPHATAVLSEATEPHLCPPHRATSRGCHLGAPEKNIRLLQCFQRSSGCPHAIRASFIRDWATKESTHRFPLPQSSLLSLQRKMHLSVSPSVTSLSDFLLSPNKASPGVAEKPANIFLLTNQF